MPRPSSPARRSSRALRAHRDGEGHLQDQLDVFDAGRAALELLCPAQPGRDTDSGARRQLAEHVCRDVEDSRQTSACRRVAAQLIREGHVIDALQMAIDAGHVTPRGDLPQ